MWKEKVKLLLERKRRKSKTKKRKFNCLPCDISDYRHLYQCHLEKRYKQAVFTTR